MLTTSLPTPNWDSQNKTSDGGSNLQLSPLGHSFRAGITALLLAVIACIGFTGCAAGGYAGGGIVGLSASSVVLDAGQSFQVTAQLSASPNLSWTMSGASCGAGGSACGTLSGATGTTVTYTAPTNVTGQLQLTLTAAVTNTKSMQTVSVTVNPDPAISGVPPAGTIGAVYATTLTASGGTAPLKLSIAGGSLPPGLTFNAATGVISGTPTTAGTYSFTAQVTDASSTPYTVKAQESISITTPTTPLTLPGGPQPAGTVGIPYTTMLQAAGGVTPYSWSITSGALPAGLTISGSTGIISGVPTTQGASTFSVQVKDASGATATAMASITINASNLLTLSTLPGGTVGVPYSATIGATGGATPYSCQIIAGTLPAGLTLTGCTVSGTPTTPGTSSVTAEVTDSSSPAKSVTGPESITIAPAPLTLTLSTLPGGTVGVPYSATIGATGGTTPYSCQITAGTLPAGLTLTGCTVSGTPTTPGTSSVTAKVTDSSSPAKTATGPESITIAPAPLTLTLSTLPGGTVGVPYSATIGATGGTTPYSCQITAGTLPAGLILTGCTVSGTPTTPGTSSVTAEVTDSSSPVKTATGPESITIAPAPLTLTLSTLPGGTVGIPYSATIGASGGTTPYSCQITAGTLPAGLILTGCTVSGTPTTPGTSSVTAKVTDSSSPAKTATGPESITIVSTSLTLTTLPGGTVGVPYSATIGASGGTTPYSCQITAGTLPAGLTLTGCTVSGTPTTPGTSSATVKVTDSSSPAKTATGPESITIAPSGTLSLTGTLPNATLGVPYSQTLVATGGLTPYSYSLTSGTLPAGISLSPTGVISGTPTVVGASSFTVTVTDSEAPQQTASLNLILLVLYPTTPYDSELHGPYAFLFQGYDDVVAGVLAYQTATVGSFTADGMGGISAGELDSNHQTSNPAGTTVDTQSFLGTYQVNSDSRGMLTVTTLNADGTIAQTATYAISLKAPVSPATIATQGDLIEFDSNQLVGTRGSGTLLAQTAAAITSGLSGSYAFGLSGDTPCLVSCTVGIASGPVATVGQFTTDGAGNMSGTGDANIATANFPSGPLNGSYQSSDQNGRVQLTLTNSSVSDGLYPSDYAVYIVNANEVFLMSTDKHSAFTLLSGTAQLQTESSFSNASIDGPIIGYENAQSDPGLLGTTLQSVLNLSTATIFRTIGAGTGTCNTTDVDSGGLTSLVDNVTGIANKVILLQALLGSSEATGTSSCEATSNGRGVLEYPQPPSLIATLLELLGLSSGPPAPRVFYLVSPNQGYFLETSYAGLGNFEPQTGAPFSLSTFDGTFVEGTIPASSLASINTSGVITANGNGQANSTLDENVGVGTLNVLQLGITGSTTYSLSDPSNNPATTGRYLLGDGTTVIYAISPNRFVLLNTSPLATSPSVSLLF